MCHDVFKNEMTEANQKIDEAAGPVPAQFKHIYVEEVIREPRIHYWTVPRLGSYMAVPLVYKSFLNVDSFDTAFKDFQNYKQRIREQNEEKAAHEITVETARAEAEATGGVYEEEEREWEEIELEPVQHVLKKFVVCIDSMGQDREFT